jgi:hypothetical protein
MNTILSALTVARAERDKARLALADLQEAFEALSREVEQDVEPDQEQPKPDPKAILKLASLGIDLAFKKKEAIRLERDVVIKEQDADILSHETARKHLQELSQRYLSAGGDLWSHQKKKIRFDLELVRSLDTRNNSFPECLMALYKRYDGLDIKRRRPIRHRHSTRFIQPPRPSEWRLGALAYYKGSGTYHGRREDLTWCHISGGWHPDVYIKASHIVPSLPNSESIGEMLFGSRAESLKRAGNSLLMSSTIKHWFDDFHLVVVPVDAAEAPITRWRTDVISPNIQNCLYSMGQYIRDLDGKELVFLDEKRPVPRFLYFRFIMSLIRIKDIKHRAWQNVWARYYEQRPFPTPGNYMRQSMILALATHFETADMRVVNSWMVDHGIDSPLKLLDEEAMEAARQVHMAVEESIRYTEKQTLLDQDSGESSEESSEDSSEE